jgi:indole-3-glycerol phosphate synthase
MAATRLDPILADVRRRAAERRARQPLARLQTLVAPDSRRRERFLLALSKPELGFIAECKRRSPSAGVLIEEAARAGTRPVPRPVPGPRWFALASAYKQGGAALLSVLTEEDHFGGSLEDLLTVAHTGLPRLRKDFILDEGMLYEACLFGADAVLLIAAILPDPELRALRELCRELGLAVLLEVHDERELERALAVEPEALGVNARDLTSMQVDLATVERLLPRVPAQVLKVAESGIRGLQDLRRVRAAGANAVLIGESLIRAEDPARLLASWREALHA